MAKCRVKSRNDTFAVVIPAYGASPHIEHCLRHLAQQTRLPDEVIVFHTGSHDPRERLGPQPDYVKIIHRPERAFAGEARNLGAALAGSDWLVFLDCDMLAAPDWLAQIVSAKRAFDADECVIVGSIGRGPSGGVWGRVMWFLECGVVLPHRKPRQLAAANGANFAISRTIFERSPRFRADLFAGEDIDLMSALSANGIKVWLAPTARADHMFEGGGKSTLNRAMQLGRAAAYVRRHADLPGSQAVTYPVLAFGLPFARMLQMLKRIVFERGPLAHFLVLSPLIFVALIAWASGFYAEARGPAVGAIPAHG